MAKHKTNISIFILVLFHLIGIGGVLLGDAPKFLLLTPLNLLLTLGIVLWNQDNWKYWWVFVATYTCGLGIEVIGIQTGWPFGTYEYSNILGPHVLQTPWIIGVNWFILLYASNSIANRIGPSLISRILIAAALMTLLDVLIEPVAIKVNFWTWENPEVPLTNYIAWFVISAALSYLWQVNRIDLNKTIGYTVFLAQLIFFSALTIFV